MPRVESYAQAVELARKADPLGKVSRPDRRVVDGLEDADDYALAFQETDPNPLKLVCDGTAVLVSKATGDVRPEAIGLIHRRLKAMTPVSLGK